MVFYIVSFQNNNPFKTFVSDIKITMSEKRVRTAPARYVSWKEGDKHAPMAIRKRKQKEKEVKQQAYQKEYRKKKKEEKGRVLENKEKADKLQAEKKKEKLFDKKKN